MKKTILAATLAVGALTAGAYTVVTERMTVHHSDGTATTYTLADVDRVSFDATYEELGLRVAIPGMEESRYEVVHTVFGQQNATTTQFAFGELAAVEEPADITGGEYGVLVSMPNDLLGQGEVTLGTGSQAQVTLYTYVDGKVGVTRADVTEGSIKGAVNGTDVTFTLSATFADGTELFADYSGPVTMVTSLADLNPTDEYTGIMTHYNPDGSVASETPVTALRVGDGDGMDRGFKVFTWEGYPLVTGNPQLKIKPEYIGSRVKFNQTASNSIRFGWGSTFQNISGPNTMGYRRGTKAVAFVKQEEDGQWSCLVDVTDSWVSYDFGDDDYTGETKGTGQRIVISYRGAAK